MLEDKINIVVFDTKTVCFNEGYFAIKAAEWVNEGIPTDEIIKRLENMRNNNSLYFCLNSLEYVVKNGRLSNAAGFIATMFKIKPLLMLNEQGQIVATEKIRTMSKALQTVVDKVYEQTNGKKCTYILHYTEMNEHVVEMKKLIEEKFPEINLYEVSTTPVVGTHIGYDGVGIGYFIEE